MLFGILLTLASLLGIRPLVESLETEALIKPWLWANKPVAP